MIFPSDSVSCITKRVYYHDTDAIGIMYYGSYMKILEEGRTDFLLQHGCDVFRLHKHGKRFIIKDLTVSYQHPSRFGDMLVCRTVVKRETGVRIIFDQTIVEEKSGTLILNATVVLVVLDTELRPVRIREEQLLS